jgi:hypothetical protein
MGDGADQPSGDPAVVGVRLRRVIIVELRRVSIVAAAPPRI